MSTAAAAADRLSALIRKNGPEFLRMPASVKAYLGQELADFPEERSVLEAAFNAGVADQVRNPSGQNREVHYRSVADRFAKTADVHPDWARWAVNVWAAAVTERTPGPRSFSANSGATLRQADQAIAARFDPDPQLKILRGGASPIWFRLFMTLIVMSGGFMGAFVGRSWPVAAIMCGFDVVDSTMGRAEYEQLFPQEQVKIEAWQKVIAYLVFFLLYSSPCALSAALGSLMGWWFGRADGRPWLGFAACFGAAFGTNTVLVLLCGCFVTVFTSFFVCFGAAYKTASTTT